MTQALNSKYGSEKSICFFLSSVIMMVLTIISTFLADTAAIKLLLEYRWGKPPQPMETNIPQGKHLIIEYVNG